MFVTETCSCKTIFTANWWKLTPYTDLKNGTITGIFPLILEKAIEMCCRDCAKQSLPEIEFLGMKNGVLEVNENIGDDTDFHFPIYGTKSQSSYGDGLPYIPFVKSPGAAFIISSANEYNESDRVMKIVFNTWPFFIFLFCWSYHMVCCKFLIKLSFFNNHYRYRYRYHCDYHSALYSLSLIVKQHRHSISRLQLFYE